MEVAALLLELGAAVEAKTNVRSHNNTAESSEAPCPPAPAVTHDQRTEQPCGVRM